MSGYAYIRNGFIENMIEWDGKTEYNPGSDVTLIEITKDFSPQQGDAYLNGVLYPRPDYKYDYTFDTEKMVWNITSESATQKDKDDAVSNLGTAQAEYDRASEQITALQQRMDDEDYDDSNTEESVKAEKSTWTTYRKALRAYIAAGDGTNPLPTAPKV